MPGRPGREHPHAVWSAQSLGDCGCGAHLSNSLPGALAAQVDTPTWWGPSMTAPCEAGTQPVAPLTPHWRRGSCPVCGQPPGPAPGFSTIRGSERGRRGRKAAVACARPVVC